MTIGEYFSGLFGGLKSLATGMGVTWTELFTKKVTQQYPENRKKLVIPPRVRGELTMPHDENNEHACTSCGICQMNCPNGTINIISKMIETEDGKKKKALDIYNYDLGMCTFCNLCVLTCPSDAIKFSTEFENAVFRRKSLNQVLNHDGSKLREKKKVAPVTPAQPKVETSKAEPKMGEVVDVKTKSEGTTVSESAPKAKTSKVVTEPTEIVDTTKVNVEEKQTKATKLEASDVKETSIIDEKIDIVTPKAEQAKPEVGPTEFQEPLMQEKKGPKEAEDTSKLDSSTDNSKNSKTNKE